MQVEQILWTRDGAAMAGKPEKLGNSAQLVLAVGGTDAVRDRGNFDAIRKAFPSAKIIGCSTAGEIHAGSVLTESLVVTACEFEHTAVKVATVELSKCADSFDAGQTLATMLPRSGLAHVLVFSDGLKVNGSELVKGLTKHLPRAVAVTGGLSGDGARFEETLVYADAPATSGIVTEVGFYGSRIKIGYGSQGGWDPFGPVRRITKAKGNILYELDSQSALELYKRYLGEHAANLPASGLLFPLYLQGDENSTPIVRSVLSVDEKTKSMTFAGDTPQGGYVQFMHASGDRLIGGARSAAVRAVGGKEPSAISLALLISCVGRRLVLEQRTAEEVEAVRDAIGPQAVTCGFYSYGEICPVSPAGKCELHNQTMTITTLGEE
jgi:hypothetical protein